MMEAALCRGHDVLVLTNAMQPMQRPEDQDRAAGLNEHYPGRITLRVSLDHYGRALHEEERGARYLGQGAGRHGLAQRATASTSPLPGAPAGAKREDISRTGYRDLIACAAGASTRPIAGQLVLFPEMNESRMCRKSPPPAGTF